MSNIIIVEGVTDQRFLEGYIAYLQETFPKKYLLIDDIQRACGQDAIATTLNSQKISIKKGEVKNIGIILDADSDGITAKIESKVNPAIEKAFGVRDALSAPVKKCLINYENREISMFCYIFNVDGKGELEDILIEIRTDKNAGIPLCLNSFVSCMQGFNEAYPEKGYKKELVYLYGYECISKEGYDTEIIRSKLKKCDYYYPKYWNFEHDLLNDLKYFFDLFL